jgi:hypothetical protein
VLQTYYMWMNMDDPLIGGYSKDKLALRRAIALGYNSAEDIALLKKGLAMQAESPLPPNVLGYDPAYRRLPRQPGPAAGGRRWPITRCCRSCRFLMLVVVALSHFIDQEELLATLAATSNWLVPGQSRAIVTEVAHFLDDRDLIGWVLVVTMLFFSSLAFTVLENAMCVIFMHRVAIRRRHFLVSALLPYCYILALGFGHADRDAGGRHLQVMGTGERAVVRLCLVAATACPACCCTCWG